MSEHIYYGKIFLKSGGHPITVQTLASSPNAARRAVESQYKGQIKQFAKQMTRTT